MYLRLMSIVYLSIVTSIGRFRFVRALRADSSGWVAHLLVRISTRALMQPDMQNPVGMVVYGEKFFSFFYIASSGPVPSVSSRCFWARRIRLWNGNGISRISLLLSRTDSMAFAGFLTFFWIGSSIFSRLNFICCTRK